MTGTSRGRSRTRAAERGGRLPVSRPAAWRRRQQPPTARGTRRAGIRRQAPGAPASPTPPPSITKVLRAAPCQPIADARCHRKPSPAMWQPAATCSGSPLRSSLSRPEGGGSAQLRAAIAQEVAHPEASEARATRVTARPASTPAPGQPATSASVRVRQPQRPAAARSFVKRRQVGGPHPAQREVLLERQRTVPSSGNASREVPASHRSWRAGHRRPGWKCGIRSRAEGPPAPADRGTFVVGAMRSYCAAGALAARDASPAAAAARGHAAGPRIARGEGGSARPRRRVLHRRDGPGSNGSAIPARWRGGWRRAPPGTRPATSRNPGRRIRNLQPVALVCAYKAAAVVEDLQDRSRDLLSRISARRQGKSWQQPARARQIEAAGHYGDLEAAAVPQSVPACAPAQVVDRGQRRGSSGQLLERDLNSSAQIAPPPADGAGNELRERLPRYGVTLRTARPRRRLASGQVVTAAQPRPPQASRVQ